MNSTKATYFVLSTALSGSLRTAFVNSNKAKGEGTQD